MHVHLWKSQRKVDVDGILSKFLCSSSYIFESLFLFLFCFVLLFCFILNKTYCFYSYILTNILSAFSCVVWNYQKKFCSYSINYFDKSPHPCCFDSYILTNVLSPFLEVLKWNIIIILSFTLASSSLLFR